MKKSSLFKKLLILAVAAASCLAFTACGLTYNGSGSSDSSGDGSSGNGGGGSVVVGGNTGSEAQSKIVINGAQNLNIGKNVTSIGDFAQKVKATRGSEELSLTVDDSAVKYGEKGVYSATYSCLTESVTITVTVYDLPTISLNEQGALNLDYSEVSKKILQGVTASDCFGADLDVFVQSYGGAKNADGSINSGSFTITYAAVDNAGQLVSVDRAVVISSAKAPVLSEAYSYDVADDNFSLALSDEDYQSFLTLSIGGTAVPSEYLSKQNGKITVSGAYLYSVCDMGVTYDMRVMASYGYADSRFVMTDEGIVAFNDSAITDFCKIYYECFAPVTLPKVSLTNSMQTATPAYSLFFGATPVALSGESVSLDNEGEYTLQVTLREGQVKTYKFQAYYNLGYANGACYTENSNVVGMLRDGYTLKRITVYCPSTQKTVLRHLAGASASDFTSGLAGLNKKYVYELTVTATNASGRELTQKTQFTVASSTNTKVALADKTTLDNGYFAVKNPDYCSLTYVYGEVAGRKGVYKWSAEDSSYSATQTLLRFGDSLGTDLVPGRYLTFSIYVQKNINVCVFLPQYEIRLWQAMKYYTEEYAATLSGSELATYENHYKGVRFFDADGNRITSGGGFNSGAFNNKWITVEIELPATKNGAAYFDITSAYCGVSIYNANNGGLYDGGNDSLATYVANVKISTQKIMSDSTVNNDAPAGETQFSDEEAYIKDNWND